MPTYFRFLTIMSFYVFLKEQVCWIVLSLIQSTVVEVGIGGLMTARTSSRKSVRDATWYSVKPFYLFTYP